MYRSICKMSGIDWRIHADFEQASRRIVHRGARYRWTSPKDYSGKSCGIVATATIRRATAAAPSSVSYIRIMLGTILDVVPVSPSNSRLSLTSSTGITADPCRVAAGAASRVRAALIASVSVRHEKILHGPASPFEKSLMEMQPRVSKRILLK